MKRSGYLASIAGGPAARTGPVLRPPRRLFGTGRMPFDDRPAASAGPASELATAVTTPSPPRAASPESAAPAPDAPPQGEVGSPPAEIRTVPTAGAFERAAPPSAPTRVSGDPATDSPPGLVRPEGDASIDRPQHPRPGTSPSTEHPHPGTSASIDRPRPLEPGRRMDGRAPAESPSPPPHAIAQPDARPPAADRGLVPGPPSLTLPGVDRAVAPVAPSAEPHLASNVGLPPPSVGEPEAGLADEAGSRETSNVSRETRPPSPVGTGAPAMSAMGPAHRSVHVDEPAARGKRARMAGDDAPRLHIGTIDVTVLPPSPAPALVAPAPPPNPAASVAARPSLSRGAGPWYGLSQR
jgi:hypothetical protein